MRHTEQALPRIGQGLQHAQKHHIWPVWARVEWELARRIIQFKLKERDFNPSYINTMINHPGNFKHGKAAKLNTFCCHPRLQSNTSRVRGTGRMIGEAGCCMRCSDSGRWEKLKLVILNNMCSCLLMSFSSSQSQCTALVLCLWVCTQRSYLHTPINNPFGEQTGQISVCLFFCIPLLKLLSQSQKSPGSRKWTLVTSARGRLKADSKQNAGWDETQDGQGCPPGADVHAKWTSVMPSSKRAREEAAGPVSAQRPSVSYLAQERWNWLCHATMRKYFRASPPLPVLSRDLYQKEGNQVNLQPPSLPLSLLYPDACCTFKEMQPTVSHPDKLQPERYNITA